MAAAPRGQGVLDGLAGCKGAAPGRNHTAWEWHGGPAHLLKALLDEFSYRGQRKLPTGEGEFGLPIPCILKILLACESRVPSAIAYAEIHFVAVATHGQKRFCNVVVRFHLAV